MANDLTRFGLYGPEFQLTPELRTALAKAFTPTSAIVYQSALQAIPSAVATAVTFNAVETDPTQCFSVDHFVAPADEFYTFTALVTLVSATPITLTLLVDGVVYCTLAMPSNTTALLVRPLRLLLQQQVKLQILQSSGGSINTVPGRSATWASLVRNYAG